MEHAVGSAKRTRMRFGMLGLVFMNVVINYLDRSNLSVAAGALSKELELSSVQLGFIFSAFGWTYAFLQIPGGLVADRFGPRILYTFCVITWSLATVFQGFARGFASLFALRLATGAFEAPSYPINNRIVTSWFPDHERASAIAMYVSGQFIGLAVLTPLLVTLQVYVGWKGLFITTGIIGLVWGVIWYLLYRDPLDHPRVNEAELAYIEEGGGILRRAQPDAARPDTSKTAVWQWANLRQVLSSRTLWGVYIGQFAVNSMLWFFLT
ncbi:MAG TPA: MFS transporter, partial [Fibrella sp.]